MMGLKHVPLETGTWTAVSIGAGVVGFIFGWIFHGGVAHWLPPI